MTTTSSTKDKTTAESLAVVQGLYKAAAAGDVPGVLSMLDENLVCHVSPSLPYGGVYRGHKGIGELFEPLAQYIALESIVFDHIIADGEHVVAVVRVPVRSSGVELWVSEHHLVRGGKVVEQRIFYFDPTLVR